MGAPLVANTAKNLTSAHSKRVFLIYRTAMKNLNDQQHYNFERFNEILHSIREEFEEYKNVKDPGMIEFLCQRAEYWNEQYRIPLPYIIPNHPGGSGHLRNEPSLPETIEDNSTEYNELLKRKAELEHNQKI